MSDNDNHIHTFITIHQYLTRYGSLPSVYIYFLVKIETFFLFMWQHLYNRLL